MTEDEFVLRVLKDFDLVDDELVAEIKCRFNDILEFDASNDNSREGRISLSTTFNELVVQGRVRDTNRFWTPTASRFLHAASTSQGGAWDRQSRRRSSWVNVPAAAAGGSGPRSA